MWAGVMDSRFQPLAFALNQVEKSSYPTLYAVIPLYNWIMDKLEDVDFSEDMILANTNKAILEKLQTYYAKTDDSRLYILSLGAILNANFDFHLQPSNLSWHLVLHPAYKIQWMQEQGWERRYVAQAKALLTRVFEQYTKSLPMAAARTECDVDAQDDLSMDFFGDHNSKAAGELDCYHGEMKCGKRQDVLAYWKSQIDLPDMQKMARHYLCIPGTSAESERVFSAGRELIGDRRAHLGPGMIRQLMLLKKWKQSFPSLTCREL